MRFVKANLKWQQVDCIFFFFVAFQLLVLNDERCHSTTKHLTRFSRFILSLSLSLLLLVAQATVNRLNSVYVNVAMNARRENVEYSRLKCNFESFAFPKKIYGEKVSQRRQITEQARTSEWCQRKMVDPTRTLACIWCWRMSWGYLSKLYLLCWRWWYSCTKSHIFCCISHSSNCIQCQRQTNRLRFKTTKSKERKIKGKRSKITRAKMLW